MNAYADAGAQVTLAFTDAGMASTYREPVARIVAALDTLLTGLISRAPLAQAEAEAATGLRVISRKALREPAEAMAALRAATAPLAAAA